MAPAAVCSASNSGHCCTAGPNAYSWYMSLQSDTWMTRQPIVVSVPHGWGDGNGDVRLRIAATQPAANSNVLSPAEVDPLSGNAILNGIPVSVSPI